MSPSDTRNGLRVLVVDDETSILDFLQIGFAYEGFEVEVVADGPGALAAFAAHQSDLVILDLNLPGLDGMEVCRQLRRSSDVPIIILTARVEIDERVEGLEAGADDYLAKPFRFKELLARVRAVLRRRSTSAEHTLRFGDIILNRSTRELIQNRRSIQLTPREFGVLEQFMLHPRHVLTREMLLDRVWGTDYVSDGNLIQVHISSLREKLGDTRRKLIRTVRGIGYTLSDESTG